MKRLRTVLDAMHYNGHVSIRRRVGAEVLHIGGGRPEDMADRYGGYNVDSMDVVDNVLVVYVY